MELYTGSGSTLRRDCQRQVLRFGALIVVITCLSLLDVQLVVGSGTKDQLSASARQGAVAQSETGHRVRHQNQLRRRRPAQPQSDQSYRPAPVAHAVRYRSGASQLPTDPWQLFNISIKQNNSKTEGLFPHVFNLATKAEISSNATCGESSPEQFCKLVEHVKRRPGDRIQCGICDASGSTYERHPVEYAIDGSNRWWQSPTIANGRQFNKVSIVLDLKQVYQVAYVIVKAANSPRPGQWVLERSLDGQVYRPWQYFAMTDSECWNVFGIMPTIGVPRYRTDDEVICSSSFSQLDPLENGEIHISLVNGRPGVEGPSQQLIEFTAARYIRLRLQRIRTLNADLMMAVQEDARYLDPTVTNRYFYSIKDISVGGQCICYGHARYCPVDPETLTMKCQCEGNTCGDSCEMCCPKFNQVKWQQGTYTEAFVCEECNCFDHADSCTFNETIAERRLSLNIHGLYQGGGVCDNCMHHTMGINCEMCEDGFYRPSGVPHNRPDACHLCLCSSVGSTGLCIKDDSDEHLGIHAGDCICREGYCGAQCDECAPGYTGYPNCEPCPCSVAGSINDDICSQCICKSHVCGEYCDKCLPGFYNLQAYNPVGCDVCFCFGITKDCESSFWGRDKIQVMTDWHVTDIAGSELMSPSVEPTDGALVITSDRTSALNHDVYWVAPKEYIGNKVAAYGGVLEYSFQYLVNCSAVELDAESYLSNRDVILEGSGMRVGLSISVEEDVTEEIQHVVSINFTELGWVHLEDSTSPPNTGLQREEFLVLLADVERFLIRATYNVHQSEMKLFKVSLDVATETGLGPRMSSVEVCRCPEGYAGTSCEMCASGYRRVGNMLVGGQCLPCNCNNHAETCDDLTGECLDCQHNTEGEHCDRCKRGYHGNALLGVDGCQPCACPLSIESNSFAEECVESPGLGGRGYMCLNCRPGYEGQFCERCSAGYYGNPSEPGGSCQPCNCHGNSEDISGVTLCDSVTGQCLACSANSEGYHCDRCRPGYYGTAFAGDCTPCHCNRRGSTDVDSCDQLTGQCRCRPHFAERDCGHCEYGYYNVTAGCIPCQCDPSVMLAVDGGCHQVTGHCNCLPGVGGSRCSECLPDHYDLSSVGCRPCSCHPEGSTSQSCDQRTGTCRCKAGVEGDKCDRCPVNHWGLNTGLGCRPCQCNRTGSYGGQCDAESGRCSCKPGVTGQACDQCSTGYFGFSSSGCRECDACTKPGHICDPLTGRCVCPPYTTGPACERCQPNSWGHDPVAGCKPCQCDNRGSSSSQCDPVTGQCPCKGNYRGLRCDKCPYGSYGLPNCKQCDCNVAGSKADECQRDVCECDDSGQCPCKDNVSGRQCTNCKRGSFGEVVADNPVGCVSCFCFGRTDRCRQAAYVWSQAALPSQAITVTVTEDDAIEPVDTEFLVASSNVPSVQVHPDDVEKPIFLSLIDSVAGDRTLSYNGHLRFKLMVDTVSGGSQRRDDSALSKAAVYIVGNDIVKLFYVPPSGSGSNQRQRPSRLREFDILLREDHWINETGHRVNRQQMMVALQNVQQWLIKLADSSGRLREARLYDVSLDQAYPAGNKDTNAFGIEHCLCPPHYTGLSCQDPTDGRYRLRPVDIHIDIDLSRLIGTSEPCQCNGRADTCDRETGQCQDCRENTAGKRCDKCADGYYSLSVDVNRLNCQPCSCPYTQKSNNFSPICTPTARRDGFICDACLPGYAGNKCERCAAGYYGNPLVFDGPGCRACDCNPQGSHNDSCDVTTGQCYCYTGITGRACDQCQPLYAVIEGRCRSCRDGCTGVLLTALDEPLQQMDDFNSSAAALLPWARMRKANTTANRLRNLLKTYNVADLHRLSDEIMETNERAQQIKQKSDKLLRQANTEEEISLDTASEMEDLTQLVQEQYSLIQDVINKLTRPVTSPGQPGTGRISDLLRQAEKWLQEIRDADSEFAAATEAAEEEVGLAEDLLETVRALPPGSGEANDAVKLQQTINDVLAKIADLRNHLVSAIERLDRLDVPSYSREVEEINNKVDQIDSEAEAARDICHNASMLNEMASHNLWNESGSNYMAMQDLLRTLRAKKSELNDWTTDMVEDMANLPPLIKRAADHAAQLQQQAARQEGLFSGSRASAADPLRAAQAYENTKRAIDEAELAVQEAINASEKAFDKIKMDGTGSLPEKAQIALSVSQKLSMNASRLMEKADDELKVRLNEVSFKIDDTAKTVKKLEKDLLEIGRGLPETSEDADDPTANIIAKAEDAQTKAEQALANVQNEIDETVNNLQPKATELLKLYDVEFGAVSNAVRSASNEVKKLLNYTESVENKSVNLRQIGLSIANNVAELKRMIREARAEANSIKVGLHHTGGCIRKYLVPSKTSLANKITLHFHTNVTNKDMLLFLLANPNTSDFMSLELIDRKVRFAWDVGAGSTFVDSMLEIEAGDKTKSTADMWYRVVAERIGNVGKLMVQKMSDPSPGQIYTAVSYPSHSRLKLNPNMDMFIAGLPSQYEAPRDVATSAFDGCIGDIEMDGNPIGLFNFQTLVESVGCNGCSSYTDTQVTQVHGIYQFDGTGYSASGDSTIRDKVFEVVLRMKVIWKDALLFFATNNKTNDFMSVEMKDGHVTFRFNFRGTNEANLTTAATYNTNEWVHVKAKRAGRQGILVVGPETVYANASGDFEDMDFSHSSIYFAGVPPTIDVQRFNVVDRGFIGCMKEVAFTTQRRHSRRINLDEGSYAGMTLGCQPNAYVVGLPGNGLVEVASQNLEKDAGIAFSFRTQNGNGIILLAKSSTGFYSISLYGGQVTVWLNGGSETTAIATTERYNDGLLHSVTLHKESRQVKLYIDDKMVGSGRMPAGAATVEGMRGEAGGLYVGGVPEEGEFDHVAPTLISFRGCIMDLIVNGKLIAFDSSVNFRDADVGRCVDSELFELETNDRGEVDNLVMTTPDVPSFTVVVTQPPPGRRTTSSTRRRPPTTTPMPTSCAEEGSFGIVSTGSAVTFGDNRHSNAEVVVQDDHINDIFNVTMSLRTYYTKGLLFYITNDDQTAYIAIQVINSTLTVIYKGNKEPISTLQSDVSIDDGEWHYLAVIKDKIGLQLVVDENAPVVDSTSNVIHVNAPIYVGGLPRFFKPKASQVLTESFKGCVKNFDLNGNPIDVANSKTIMGVRQCFLRAERGVHFDGYGYATYAEDYSIVHNFTVSFDFRTTQRDGVLLSTSGMGGALAVNMHNGKLKFKVVKSDTTVYVIETKLCEYCLCNNIWHSVTAQMLYNRLSLTVDGKTWSIPITPIELEYDVYISGFPVSAEPQLATDVGNFFQGCLRNVRVQNEMVDWHAIEELVDIYISDCPLAVDSDKR